MKIRRVVIELEADQPREARVAGLSSAAERSILTFVYGRKGGGGWSATGRMTPNAVRLMALITEFMVEGLKPKERTHEGAEREAGESAPERALVQGEAADDV